jgi:SAM-dependent methyltransferase
VLELGCGTGRLADALVALGHPTTGVDQSAAMLAHVHRAAPVLADIEGLDLGRRFDGVVLASHLVNVADPARGRRSLPPARATSIPAGWCSSSAMTQPGLLRWVMVRSASGTA